MKARLEELKERNDSAREMRAELQQKAHEGGMYIEKLKVRHEEAVKAFARAKESCVAAGLDPENPIESLEKETAQYEQKLNIYKSEVEAFSAKVEEFKARIAEAQR